MKKALIIIVTILAIIVMSVVLVFASISKPRTSISADDFMSIMKEKGFEVAETTSVFEQYEDYLSRACAARNSNYQLEFYELTSDENAIDMFNTNKEIFESQKGDSSTYSTLSGSNYSTYTLTTDGKFKYIKRINNTMIFLNVDEEYKSDVKELLKELGY